MLKHLLMKEGRQEETNKDAIATQFGNPCIALFATGTIDKDTVFVLAEFQCPVRLLKAEFVPSEVFDEEVVNYTDVALGILNEATGALSTTFDTQNNTAAKWGAGVVGVTESFSIDPSTDTLTAGQKLAIKHTHAAVSTKVVAGTYLVWYQPIEAAP